MAERLSSAPRLLREAAQGIELPHVEVPRPKLGDVVLQDVRLPDVTVPRPRLGEVTMQDMRLPDVTLPRPRLGEVTLQDVQLPDVTLPRPRLGEVTVQDVQLPDITLPRPRMGEINVRDMQLPSLTLPRPRLGEVAIKDVRITGPDFGGPARGLRRLIKMAVLGVAGVALYQEMSKPEDQRQWHGRALGVPYDFRPPTSERLREAWWNDKAGLITPMPWGLGWTINLRQAMAMVQRARSK